LLKRNKLKNILDIVSYRYLPYTSGGQKSIALFLESLGQISNLHVAGTENNDITVAKHYKLHPLLVSNIYRYIDIRNIFEICKLIKKNKIETLIIEHPYIGWLGVIVKKITNIKLVFHTHNIEYERFRSLEKWWWKILKYYETWVLKNADVIFCISDEDKRHMKDKMGIDEIKCITIPYGIIQKAPPTDKIECKEIICRKHNLDPDVTLLFFNGLLDYEPNTDALYNIIENINPFLQKSNIKYNILIAGKNLPSKFGGLKKWNKENIFYAGFVDDIDQYTKAADIFLNPVNKGGGVKTKMIEALGLGATVIATKNGALGVDQSVCGDKIKIVENDDWEGFANQIQINLGKNAEIPNEYFEKYNWNKIAERCLSVI